MSNITATTTTNDGRQWFAVTFAEDQYGVEAGTHDYALCSDGALIDSDGHPVDYNESLRRAVLALLTNQLKTEIAAVQAEWDTKRTGIQHLRAMDKVQNEGGEGYSAYEAAAERLANEYMPRITELSKASFATEWTREVFDRRRSAWNAEMQSLSARKVGMTAKVMQDVVSKVGFTLDELRRAKALHGIK